MRASDRRDGEKTIAAVTCSSEASSDHRPVPF